MKSKLILGLGLILATTKALIAAPQYSITPLGTLGGDKSFANDINDSGQIVGHSQTSQGINHAYVSSIDAGNRVMTDLGSNQKENSESFAKAINNKGQIVGYFSVQYHIASHAFISEKLDNTWVMTDLHPYAKVPDFTMSEESTGSYASDINDSAQIIGARYSNEVPHNVFVAYKNDTNWSFTTALPSSTQLPAAKAPISTSTPSINNSEQITFSFFDRPINGSRKDRGIVASYINGSWNRTDLNSFSIDSMPVLTNNINDLNQITGNFHVAVNSEFELDQFSPGQHAFIATKSENKWILTDLGLLKGQGTNGRDINDSGVVVGSTSEYEDAEAFIYVEEQMHSLINLVSKGLDGWTNLQQANSINNSGQIVGEGTYNGKKMAYLLTPISKSTASCEVGLDPQVIRKGEGTALWWWSKDALSANINNGIGDIELPSNYKWIYPTESKTFK